MSDLLNARLKRTRDVVEMKKVDKIPVSINGPAFLAKTQGLTIAQYISDFDKAAEAAIGFMDQLKTADSLQTPIMWPEALSLQWLSKVHMPGFDLPDDELWQVDEQEVVKFDDYQYILDHGFAAFRSDVLLNRLHVDMKRLGEYGAALSVAARRCAGAGYPVINAAGCAAPPFELFCGGRALMNFFVDLMSEPELIARVFKEAMTVLCAEYTAALEACGGAAMGAWVGGWRGAPSMISHDVWEEFVWPYMKEMTMITINHGYVPIFHLDSNWDREFASFTELPARKSILALDGSSDIRLCRKAIGDHSAIMGDVPASILAFSTANEVYEYTTRIIDDVGPGTGLIVSSGCDIPLNAKFENVKAMVDAAAEYKL